MELIYTWIESYHVLKNIGINFSNRYEVKETISNNDRVIKLSLIERPDSVPNFFPKGILSVTAIVGENGVGKSTLLDFINLVNHRPNAVNCHWVAVYRTEENGAFVIHSSIGTRKDNTWSLEYDKRKFRHENLLNSKENPLAPPIISIFYNPSLDLKDYGQSFNDIDAGFVNVATNFLIHDDWNNRNTNDDKIDQVLNHRFKNAYRQFALSELKNPIRQNLRIPDEIEVRFNKNRTIAKEDLSNKANDTLNILLEKGRRDAQSINAEIQSASKNKDNDGFIAASLKKVKHWFLVNLLENYFSELSKSFDFENERFNRLVDMNVVSGGSFANSVIRLFEMQDFITSEHYSIKQFIDEIFQIIDSFGQINVRSNEIKNDSIFVIPSSKAILVHQSNMKFLSLFSHDTENPNLGFLDFNWRDVSNGEKAYLDLYSRIFDGYRKLQHLVNHKPTLFIVIDEGEIGFHPQWQKEYLNSLIKFIRELTKGLSVQVIVSSHSPFVLSDLPKSNVVLLNANDLGVFVDRYSVKRQTFAANIHELFADSFFLKSETIGDFARSKIESLIAGLKSRKKINDLEVESIKKEINLIGEPIIRDRLNDMYKERFSHIETTENRITRLEKELKNAREQLRNIRNDTN